MSLSGLQRSDDRPMAMSTPALVTLRISDVVDRSAEISGVATSSDVLEKVTHSVIQLTTNRIRYLRHDGRSLPVRAGGGEGEGGRDASSRSVSIMVEVKDVQDGLLESTTTKIVSSI